MNKNIWHHAHENKYFTRHRGQVDNFNDLIIELLSVFKQNYKLTRLFTELKNGEILFNIEVMKEDRLRQQLYLEEIYNKSPADYQKMLDDASDAINILEEEKIELQIEINRLKQQIADLQMSW